VNLANLAVRRGVTFGMIYLIVIGWGIFALSQLRLDMYPDITFPQVSVVATYAGASPEDIETVVTRPIEEAVSAIEGVKHVLSTSKDGIAMVTVELEWGTDTDKAERDIRKYLDMISSFLPPDLDRPMTFAFDPSMQPIMLAAVSGPFSQAELRHLSEHVIEPRLERIEGVAQASTAGGLKREIQVRLWPERLEAYGLSNQQVLAALRMNNLRIPGGEVSEQGREFVIQAMGQYGSMDEIREVVVGLSRVDPLRAAAGLRVEPTPIKLRMVAEVADAFHESRRIIRHNGRPGILLIVRKQSDANSVQACNRVEAELPRILASLPAGVVIVPIFNQSDFIEQSIGNLSGTAWAAFGLTFLVLLLFLSSLRASISVAVAIPVSVVATFVAMYAAGITLNIISLAGLALAVGMLVDNAIVVLESIFRHTEAGLPRREAAVVGAREVGMAITASTLTTVGVFAPILFVPGIAGMMFRDMALTICFSLSVSLMVALSLVPLMASRLLKERQRSAGACEEGGLARFFQNGICRLQTSYGRVLAWCLSHPWLTLLVVAGVLGASALAYPWVKRDFFAQQDTGIILFQAEAMVGTSLEEADRLYQELEEIVRREVPEASDVLVDLGSAEGWMAMFSKGSYSGLLRLKLLPLAERKRRGLRDQQKIEKDLREAFQEVAGLKTGRFMFFSFGTGNNVLAEIYGEDLERLQAIGLELKREIAEVPNASEVQFSMEEAKPELGIYFDRTRMSALGLSTGQVAQMVSTYFQGSLAGRYREAGWEYDILVRLPRERRLSRLELENLPVPTPTGASVPLKSIARVGDRVGPVEITRKDQQRKVTVNATVEGPNMGQVIADIQAILDAYRQTHEVGEVAFAISGSAEDFQESFMFLGIAVLVAILLVYMIMAAQFEAFLPPLLIISSMPLAGLGVLWILLATDTALSVPGLIGLVLLVGVVVNNAIVMVDYTIQLRGRGLKVPEACLEAGMVRMRPVLMTALTTILGMMPLALGIGEGAEAWAPMARTIIGGLATGSLLTLVVIPVVYRLVEGGLESRRDRRAARAAAASSNPS
jgi:HAE1 family hydrophobic/amphiphilic exporter-1